MIYVQKFQTENALTLQGASRKKIDSFHLKESIVLKYYFI